MRVCTLGAFDPHSGSSCFAHSCGIVTTYGGGLLVSCVTILSSLEELHLLNMYYEDLKNGS